MPKHPSAKPAPPSRADILLDIQAALLRDTDPVLPLYDPAAELTISDMLTVKPSLTRVTAQREMIELKAAGKWTSRDVMVPGRKGVGARRAVAWRPVSTK